MTRSTRHVFRVAFQTATLLLDMVPAVLQASEGTLSPAHYAVLTTACGSTTAITAAVTRITDSSTAKGLISRFAPWLSLDQNAGQPPHPDALSRRTAQVVRSWSDPRTCETLPGNDA